MPNYINFSDISAYKENNRIEAKLGTGGFPNTIWETYSAFANTVGGIIIIGVEETQGARLTLAGLPDAKATVKRIWQGLNDTSVVSVNILKEEDVMIQTIDGKDIVAIQIPKANRHQKPVYIGYDVYKGTYRRNGEGDYRCSRNEIENMIRDSSDTSADIFPISRISALNGFDKKALKDFLRLIRNTTPAYKSTSDTDILLSLGALIKNLNGDIMPTAGAILLLGKEEEIQREFPDFKAIFTYKQPVNGKTESCTTHHTSNLYSFYTKVTKEINESFSMLEDEFDHILSAVHEAIINAIIHADYFAGGGIDIAVGIKNITVKNPGNMRLDVDNSITDGSKDTRNAVLSTLFTAAGLTSGTGHGLTKINDVLIKNKFNTPKITEEFGPDCVVVDIDLESTVKTSPETQRRVIYFLTSNIEATLEDLTFSLGIGKQELRICLHELLLSGYIMYKGVGNDRLFYMTYEHQNYHV